MCDGSRGERVSMQIIIITPHYTLAEVRTANKDMSADAIAGQFLNVYSV